MSDVQNVIQELCYSGTPVEPLPLASRGEIDRLLQSHREETQELSELRSRHKLSHEKSQKSQTEKNLIEISHKSYSERLQEYYQKMKYHEEDENDDNDDDNSPNLDRNSGKEMTTEEEGGKKTGMKRNHNQKRYVFS